MKSSTGAALKIRKRTRTSSIHIKVCTKGGVFRCRNLSDSIPVARFQIWNTAFSISSHLYAKNCIPATTTLMATALASCFTCGTGTAAFCFPGDIICEGMKHVLDEGKGVEKRYTVFSRSRAESNPESHCKTNGQPGLKSLLTNMGLTILVHPTMDWSRVTRRICTMQLRAESPGSSSFPNGDVHTKTMEKPIPTIKVRRVHQD